MRTRVYSIKDIVAVEFGPMFWAKNNSVAMRNFKNFINDQYSKNENFIRDDFELYCIGVFNNETGIYEEVFQERVIVALNMEAMNEEVI